MSPTDTYHDLRGDMVNLMRQMGITVEAHHHEVGTAGQCEIDMKFMPLLQMADQFMWYKYIVTNVANGSSASGCAMRRPVQMSNAGSWFLPYFRPGPSQGMGRRKESFSTHYSA